MWIDRVLIVLLQALWIQFSVGQKLIGKHPSRTYGPQSNPRNQNLRRQYPINSRGYPVRGVLNNNRNTWQRRQQALKPIHNPSGPRLVYPGSHNLQGRQKYPINAHPQYSQRFTGNAPYQSRPYPNAPYRPGYVPAYRPRPQYPRRYPIASGRFRPQTRAGSKQVFQQGNRDFWGPWGAWSGCSRSCDGGVRTRTRSCQSKNKPVEINLHRGSRNNVNQGNCAGSPHDFQPCSTKLCTSRKSFKDQKYEARMVQCAEYNHRNYLGKKYQWVPYIRATLNECRLYCMAKGHRMFVELAKRVKDGTPCGEDGTEACYHGECSKHRPSQVQKQPQVAFPKPETSRALEGAEQNVQYRERQEVKFVEKVINGMFNSTDTLKVGYNTIFKIPIGATNLYIAEAKPSRNYLALRIDGKYIVNGGWQIDLSKEINAAGTLIRYKITPGQYSTESFTAKGPIRREIDVQLLYQEEKPLVIYNYTMKVPDVIQPRAAVLAHAPSLRNTKSRVAVQYQWRISSMTPCSAPCGGGEQEFIHRCSSLRPDGSPTFVSDFLCGSARPPKSKRVCNMHPCPSRWVTLQWKPCTKTCGRGGMQLRDIRCRKLTKRNGKDTEINVPISQCNIQTRPEIQRECPYRPCYRQWKSEEWSGCSKSCDKGEQTRVVHCVTEDGYQLRHDACDQAKKPEQKRTCNRQPCQSTWFTSQWNECSTQCGEGVQRRIVYCAGVAGSAVPDGECNAEERPFETRKCQTGSCRGIWLASNWTKCSSVCGAGVQSRVVICAAVHHGKFQEVSALECNTAARPAAKQKCSPGPCSETVWFMTPWNECSVQCGTGIQRRQVTCLTSDGHAGRGCQLEEKPSEVQRCESRNCGRRKDTRAGYKQATPITDGTSLPHRVPENVKRRGEDAKAENDPMLPIKTWKRKQVIPKTDDNNSRNVKGASENSYTDTRKLGPNHVYHQPATSTSPQGPPPTSYFYEKRYEPVTTAPKPITTVPTTTLRLVTTTTRQSTSTRPPSVKQIDSSRLSRIRQSQNLTCKDEKSVHYCKVILRLQFCKFTVYRKRCCGSCRKQS